MPGIQFDDVMPTDLRGPLESLATAIFQLGDWLKDPAKYVPPQANLPWRAAGQNLTPTSTGALDFIEELLHASSGDDDLGARWAAIIADPLKFSPIDDPHGWRRRRGMSDTAKFGIIAGANVWLSDAGGTPISRRTFYAASWAPLRAAIAAAPPANDAD